MIMSFKKMYTNIIGDRCQLILEFSFFSYFITYVKFDSLRNLYEILEFI